jgi:hypothetical protein
MSPAITCTGANAAPIVQPLPAWKDLVDVDPQLEQLRYRAECFRKKVRRAQARDRFWYETLKPQVERRVGWFRYDSHPLLSTQEAYDVAYAKISDAVGVN